MACKICAGRPWVELEPRMVIPCPLCDTDGALAAVKKARAAVEARVAGDEDKREAQAAQPDGETRRLPSTLRASLHRDT